MSINNELADAVGLVRASKIDPAAMIEVINSLNLLESRLMVTKLVTLVRAAKTIGIELELEQWCEEIRANVLKLG